MYNGKELEKILPHKFPMILIDRVVSFDMESKTLISEIEIRRDSMFFDRELNQVPAWVGIEFMAQTIGALSGIFAREFAKAEVKLGFVIGARNYECFASGFDLGSCLTVKVEQSFFDSELGSFNCVILNSETKMAQAQMNVFQPASVKDFFENYE